MATRRGTFEWFVIAQHGHVVERVEVVLGDPAPALRLPVGDLAALQADVGDHAPAVRVGVVDLPQDLDHPPIVEPEAGDVLHQLDVGQLRRRP